METGEDYVLNYNENYKLEIRHYSIEGEILDPNRITEELDDTLAIYLWNVNFPAPANVLALLQPDEIARAESYKFARHKNMFLNARGILRVILGRHLQMSPQEIDFEYNSFGKPRINDLKNKPGISFNLSHTEEMAACVIVKGRQAGIDIESLQRNFSKDFMDEVLTEKEREAFGAASGCNYAQLWTIKESWVKLTGLGIGSLDRVPDLSVFDFRLALEPVVYVIEDVAVLTFAVGDEGVVSVCVR